MVKVLFSKRGVEDPRAIELKRLREALNKARDTHEADQIENLKASAAESSNF